MAVKPHSKGTPVGPDDAWIERLADKVAERVAALIQPRQGHYDMDQAARYLGMCRRSLEKRLHEVPHFRLGKKRLFRPQELDEWLEKHRVRPPETEVGRLVDEILEKVTR